MQPAEAPAAPTALLRPGRRRRQLRGSTATATAPALWHRPWFQRVIVWGLLAVGWQAFGYSQGSFFFPTFSSTLSAFPHLADNGELTTFLRSLEDILLGFVIAAGAGILLGFLIGLSKWFRWSLQIYLDALFVTSFSAFLPFLIVLLGTDRTYRITVVVLFAVVYVAMSTASGVRAVDPGFRDVSMAFGASRVKHPTDVVFFSALPYILTGLRLAMAQSVQGLIVAQLWVDVGTGSDLTNLSATRNLPDFFALALVIAITGAALVQLLGWCQRRLTPWGENVGEAAAGNR